MLKLDYTVKLLAPVTFAEKSGDNVLYATKKYIPGSAIRGALAKLVIDIKKLGKDAHLDDEFFSLFLAGKLKFLPCYYAENGKAVIPAPCSLMVDKAGENYKDYANEAKLEAGFKKLSGFVNITNNEVAKLNPNISIEFHMSRASEMERVQGSSRDGAVFNYEYLEAFQTFKGSVIAKDGDRALLEKIASLLKKYSLRLGRSKNAQYGSAKAEAVNISQVKPEAVGPKIYLYALTPYIMNSGTGRIDEAAAVIAGKIAKALKLNTEISIGKLFVNTEAVDGYVGTWNIKRERKQAISAGSLIELKLDSKLADQNTLAELLYNGLGERTEEGFGQFRIWSPLANAKKAVVAVKAMAKVEIPKEVKERAIEIMQNRILVEIRKLAQEDAVCTKAAEKAKGTLKRVELLMNSKDSKIVIKQKLAEFKGAANSNLRDVKINGYGLDDVLLEQNGAKVPYANINWALDKLELTAEQKNNMEKMLGINIFAPDADVLYREYWLWFMRHTAKKLNAKAAVDQKDNTIGANAKLK